MLYEDRVARFRWSVPATFNFASDVVDVWAEDRGRVALYRQDERGRDLRLTFRDLSVRSRRLANGLGALGLSRGDRVVVAVPAAPERFLAWLAVLRLGGVVVPCPSGPPAEEAGRRARHVGARAVVAAGKALAAIDGMGPEGASPAIRVAVGERAPAGWRAFDDLVREGSAALEPVATRPDEPALLLFPESGASSRAPVLHGHGYTWAHRYTGEHWLDLRSTDLHWTTSDDPYAGGFFAPWSLGAPLFAFDGRLDPPRLLSLVEEQGVTTLCAPSDTWGALAAEPLGRSDLGRLRHGAATGAPLGAEAYHAWKDAVGLAVHHGWGLAETALLVADVRGLPVRPGSAGRPFPGHDVRIVDARGEEAAVGETGEVVLRGRPPTLFLGRWKEEGPDAAAQPGDAYRTGRSASRDGQGYFWLTDSAGDAPAAAPPAPRRRRANAPRARRS